ncbi:hypothetical protein CDL15_Pgr017552 [Punica granatum]|uniref:Uncharacterized protein n=1 Tax=Punica granatum TaxID=22663 RepID=A0A218W529_PUNGR|nr:hypothetical protein CDL15_Pgr017552 [Punica granatum]PKI47141.1 hypothetical protein CRG98_032455 [Punica granatum]
MVLEESDQRIKRKGKGKVSFVDNPHSSELQPSDITIGTKKKDSCDSSFSDALSVMASIDASEIAVEDS